MAAEVELPAVGKVRQPWVLAGAGTVVVIVGVAWWRRRSQPAVSGPVVDPATGTDSTDPTYRNPGPVFTGGGDDSKLPPTTDQEWSQRVMERLNYLEPSYLADVLGKYLSRQELSLGESAAIRAAWALEGKPPSNTPIILSQAGSTPGTSPADQGPIFARVAAGWLVNQWIRDLQAGYGTGGQAKARGVWVNWEQILSLNPGISGNIKWDGKDNERNTFKSSADYRIA